MDIPWTQYAALFGATLAMGLGALGPGLGLGLAATGAVRAASRQPATSGNAFRNMLVAQAITETPAIFALVVSFMLLYCSQLDPETTYHGWVLAVGYLSAGACIGIGSLGSGIGSGLVGRDALKAIGERPSAQGPVLMYMLVGQAWVQTGGIFALVVSMLMINAGGGLDTLGGGEAISRASQFVSAGVSMGFGSLGPALGLAYVTGRACTAMARSRVEHHGLIRNAFFVGSATTQSPAIYALIIALLVLF